MGERVKLQIPNFYNLDPNDFKQKNNTVYSKISETYTPEILLWAQ